MNEDLRTAGRSRAGSPPATAAAAQVLSRLAELARASLKTQASLTKQSVDLTWSTIVGDLDRTSANKAYLESVTRESARYWRTVGELGVDYASDLVTLSKSVSTTVLREVAAAGRKAGNRRTTGATTPSQADQADQADQAHHGGDKGGSDLGGQVTYSRTSDADSSVERGHDNGARRVAVTLRGSVGQRAEGTITVANQHPRPRRIQLTATELADSVGAPIGAALEVSPTSLTVPSEQERKVSLGVDLDETFLAGQRYSCTVEVSGGDEATIEVSVDVVA